MTLREESTKFLTELYETMHDGRFISVSQVEAFAKRQRAAGLREAHTHFSHWFEHGETDVEDEIDWCEAKAKEYET